MKKHALVCLLLSAFLFSKSQHSFRITVTDSSSLQPLKDLSAIWLNSGKGGRTNKNGVLQFNNLPAGPDTILLTYAGYAPKQFSITLPVYPDSIHIFLQAAPDELAEVIVQSTRTSRTIANTPTRVETIDGEELDEKNNMRPANVSMLLHESTGMQVQQTSATSGNASIRVQGLDGRYTQLLKDGYPNFGNFASGLSILEIPPLDLKQVEVIKGPASTLYGGGAIAGVINFISKAPSEKGEYNLIINQSNIGQTNIGAYASKRKNRFAYTLLASANFQKAYDVDKDDFSELPKSSNFTIHPRLFYYPDARTSIMLGNSFTKGSNRGGDMLAISNKADSSHVYFEDNNTIRNTTTLEAERQYDGNRSIRIRQSVSIFNRKIALPAYLFSGKSLNSYTDISYLFHIKKHTMIAGGNYITDRFVQQLGDEANANSTTAAVYLEDTWDISNHIKIESGVRVDHVNYRNTRYNQSQAFVLPRVSALFKISGKLSSRIGGGLGYKVPTIFTEQTEAMQYRRVLALDNVTAEKSLGGTADINYRTSIGNDFSVSINQLFFYTRINKPLLLQQSQQGDYFFSNAGQPVTSRGFETNLKFIFKKDLKLFIGYTFTDAKAAYAGNTPLFLLPKDKLNLALVYEKEGNFKVGLEGYLTGNQVLYNGVHTPSFWEFGVMAEKTLGKLALFINFENFTDQRQSKYKRVVNPPHNNPTFDDIWNHAEGFVMNGGIKIKL